MLKKTFLATSMLLLASGVQAGGGYIGASIGQTDLDVPGLSKGDSFAFTGGYRVNENFAVEAAYINLGDSDDGIAPVWTVETTGLNFSAVAIAPLNDTVEVFAKLGMYSWDLSIEEAGFGEFYSNDGNDVSAGVGILANLSDQFSLVFEYQSFEVDEEDASNISFGARANF